MNPEFLGILAGGPAHPMTLPLVFFILGLLTNVIKVCILESVSLRKYFTSHKYRTSLSGASLIASFYVLYTTYPDASWLLFVFCGYFVDSMMNKAPLTAKKLQKEIIE